MLLLSCSPPKPAQISTTFQPDEWATTLFFCLAESQFEVKKFALGDGSCAQSAEGDKNGQVVARRGEQELRFYACMQTNASLVGRLRSGGSIWRAKERLAGWLKSTTTTIIIIKVIAFKDTTQAATVLVSDICLSGWKTFSPLHRARLACVLASSLAGDCSPMQLCLPSNRLDDSHAHFGNINSRALASITTEPGEALLLLQPESQRASELVSQSASQPLGGWLEESSLE